MKKKIFDYLWLIVAVVAIILLAFLLIIVLPARMNAEKAASEKGDFVGNVVGSCIGSLDGLANGLEKGDEAGKQYALEAKDTTVKMIGKVHDIGKLEVLNLSLKRSGILQMDNGKTNSLYMQKCDASFSIDLKKAEISDNGNQIIIEIPYPVLDEVSYEPAVELTHYSTSSFVGSSENGVVAYLNSQNEIKKKIEEELAADTEIYEQAKNAAIGQVMSLFEGISIDDKEVTVKFAEEKADGAE